jgi:hypothetical protein
MRSPTVLETASGGSPELQCLGPGLPPSGAIRKSQPNRRDSHPPDP